MAAPPIPLPPGSMTVPPWSGWETLAVAVVLLLVAGVVFLVVGAVRSGSARQDEWRALLEARGSRGGPPLDDGLPVPRQPLDVPSR